MPWNVPHKLTSGWWSNWTATWNTGQDLWGASNMTQYNHRYTKVGGTLYAYGSLHFTSNSNFGNGGAGWSLWLPHEWLYPDTNGGGRIIGEGFVGCPDVPPYRALHFTLQMVNTFNVFATPVLVQPTGQSGNYNAGADNLVTFDRTKLQWIANGGNVNMYYSLRYITDNDY